MGRNVFRSTGPGFLKWESLNRVHVPYILLKQRQRNSFVSIAMGSYDVDMKSGGDSLFNKIGFVRSFFLYILS